MTDGDSNRAPALGLIVLALFLLTGLSFGFRDGVQIYLGLWLGQLLGVVPPLLAVLALVFTSEAGRGRLMWLSILLGGAASLLLAFIPGESIAILLFLAARTAAAIAIPLGLVRLGTLPMGSQQAAGLGLILGLSWLWVIASRAASRLADDILQGRALTEWALVIAVTAVLTIMVATIGHLQDLRGGGALTTGLRLGVGRLRRAVRLVTRPGPERDVTLAIFLLTCLTSGGGQIRLSSFDLPAEAHQWAWLAQAAACLLGGVAGALNAAKQSRHDERLYGRTAVVALGAAIPLGLIAAFVEAPVVFLALYVMISGLCAMALASAVLMAIHQTPRRDSTVRVGLFLLARAVATFGVGGLIAALVMAVATGPEQLQIDFAAKGWARIEWPGRSQTWAFLAPFDVSLRYTSHVAHAAAATMASAILTLLLAAPMWLFHRASGRMATTPQPTCGECDADNAPAARFCKACGAALTELPGAVEPPIRPFGRTGFSLLAATLVLLSALIGWGVWRKIEVAKDRVVYVTRLVRVRTAPTVEGSAVLGSLTRGETLRGRWVTATDGETQWLKTLWAGAPAYVWGRNLSDQPRPALTSSPFGKLILARPTTVLARPALGAKVLTNLAAGETVEDVGAVTGGWREIALAKGGVGYIAFSGHVSPVSYCADVRDIEEPDGRYAGPEAPDWMARVMQYAPGGPASLSWRCKNGRVLACVNLGITGPCEKRDISREPTEAMRQYCRQEPDAPFIAAAVTGHYTIYSWACRGGDPYIERQFGGADEDHFGPEDWTDVTSYSRE